MSASRPTTRRRLGLLGSFAVGQVLSQLLTMLAGFVALRTMSVSDFAQYSLAFAFSSVLGSLVDIGFTRAIIALVGDRTDDWKLIAKYIAVARRQRNVLTAIFAPVGTVLFMVMSANRGWSLETRIALITGIVASVWLQGWIAMYAIPLLVRSDMRRYYAPQSAGSASRLAGFLIAAALGVLVPVIAIGLNVAYFGFLGHRLRRASLRYIPDWREADPELTKEMNAYVRPLWPGIVFFAAQSQMSIFLVAAVASTKTVGEVAALNRIATLFIILVALNHVLVEPFVARTPAAMLVRRYLSILGLVVVGSVVVVIAAALEPRPLLWLLGSQYGHLREEAILSVLAASLSYIAYVLWTMNNARRWVFGWLTTLYIVLTLATQAISVLVLDLETTRGAVLFGVATSIALVAAHAVGAWYGLRRVAHAA